MSLDEKLSFEIDRSIGSSETTNGAILAPTFRLCCFDLVLVFPEVSASEQLRVRDRSFHLAQTLLYYFFGR